MKSDLKKAQCPKAGFVLLYTGGETFVRPTSCKTWGCTVCRKSLLSLVQGKMEYGCLTLEHSYFTTLTLRNAGPESLKDAVFVRKVWERLLKSLKAGPYPNLAWFKVIELTKKKQPHLHLLIGGIGELKAQCRIPDQKLRKQWMEMTYQCPCVAHTIGRVWYELTGAYIIDCKKVYAARGIATYLGGYLTKGYDDRSELEARGFLRRYSTSRNWPGNKRVRLRGTVEERWDGVTRIPRETWNWQYLEGRIKNERPAEIMERVGTDLAHYLEERGVRARKRQVVKTLERIVNSGNKSIQEHDVGSEPRGVDGYRNHGLSGAGRMHAA